MVKIIHMADTHLGYRARRGAINQWSIENYSRPYEQEIYDTFLDVMTEISKMDDLDFVIHCGDMFHQPSERNPFPPNEPARRVLKKGLDIFFKNTENKVPFIYIEGNHGIFKGYDYTPFESHISQKKYPELYYFKEGDLKNAINEQKPLQVEFPRKQSRFYLFPYFEFNNFEVYKNAYDKWVYNQQPSNNDDFINIAVAHGSPLDHSLHEKVLSDDFNYDYIALGHEHGLKAQTKNRYFSGSLLPLNFKEIYKSHGYIIVDVNSGEEDLEIKKIKTDKLLKRSFEEREVRISPQESTIELKEKIQQILDDYKSEEGFNANTAGRVKIKFEGEMSIEKVWQINELMVQFRRSCFSKIDKYNILQLIWKTSDISAYVEEDSSPGVIEDFILEEPEKEFRSFVEEKLTENKTKFDISKLTKFGIAAIKDALEIMDTEEEV
ncbi:MAG: metallophosphoesterase [Promethearchaeia archaeon]